MRSFFCTRNSVTVLLLCFFFGCQSYSAGDLNGKWICNIDNEPIEVWINDTLAIGMDYENQFLYTYDVQYEGRILTFTNIDWLEGSTWQEKVLSFDRDEFKTELQNPGNRAIIVYKRISQDVPDISDDYNENYEKLETYLASKLPDY